MRAFSNPKEIDPKPQGIGCYANGCKLAGSNGSGDKWFCRFHINVNFSDFAPITKDISENYWLMDAFFKLTQSEKHFGGDNITTANEIAFAHLVQKVKERNREDLLPTIVMNRYGRMCDENNDNYFWADRFFNTFNLNILKNIKSRKTLVSNVHPKFEKYSIKELANGMIA